MFTFLSDLSEFGRGKDKRKRTKRRNAAIVGGLKTATKVAIPSLLTMGLIAGSAVKSRRPDLSLGYAAKEGLKAGIKPLSTARVLLPLGVLTAIGAKSAYDDQKRKERFLGAGKYIYS